MNTVLITVCLWSYVRVAEISFTLIVVIQKHVVINVGKKSPERKCDMDTAKDMYKVYSKTSTADLIKNRNRKTVQLFRLGKLDGYWVRKEKERLAHMISQIDAVIESRKLQEPLF